MGNDEDSTVTPPYRGRPDAETDGTGPGYALGLVVLLVPMLPFLLIVWLVSKGLETWRGR